jgi:hypothetical protein
VVGTADQSMIRKSRYLDSCEAAWNETEAPTAFRNRRIGRPFRYCLANNIDKFSFFVGFGQVGAIIPKQIDAVPSLMHSPRWLQRSSSSIPESTRDRSTARETMLIKSSHRLFDQIYPFTVGILHCSIKLLTRGSL